MKASREVKERCAQSRHTLRGDGGQCMCGVFAVNAARYWSLSCPGLAPSTSLTIEYDERSEVCHVITCHVAVDGTTVRHSVPFAPRELGQVLRVTSGWPWRLTGE